MTLSDVDLVNRTEDTSLAIDRKQIDSAISHKFEAYELKDSVRGTVLSAMNYNYGAREVALFEREIQLRDGFSLQLRHLRKVDREQMKAFFARCSTEAIRFRFLSSIKAPSDSLLKYLVEVDGLRHVALIVSHGIAGDEKIVAEGRYVVSNERSDTADIAFLVVDEWQRRGIAMLLLHQLMKIACRNGVTHFSADVLADNRAMITLFRKTGLRLSATVSTGVLHFDIPVSCIEKDRLLEAA